MAITAITIENFKGIKAPVRVELKPITLLFGPNSAGKSTVIQALHYAREIFERHNLNPDRTLLGGDSIDLGGFESLVYQHDLSLPIRIKFDLDLSSEDLPRYLEGYEEIGLAEWEDSDLWNIPTLVESAWVEISIRWSRLLDAPLLSSYSVGINGEELASIETTNDGRQIELVKLASFNPIFLEGSSPEQAREIAMKVLNPDEEYTSEDLETLGDIFLRLFELLNTSNGVPGITRSIALALQKSALPQWGTPLKFHPSMWNKDVTFHAEGTFIQLLSTLITGPGEMVRDTLRKFSYLGPLREVPNRGFRPATSPDISRWANGLAAWDILYQAEDELLEKMSLWLCDPKGFNTNYYVDVKKYRELDIDNSLTKQILDVENCNNVEGFCHKLLEIPVKRRLVIKDVLRDIELSPQDLGVGVSQVLPVLVAALSKNMGLMAIEQPELHIHPAWQVALGDIFIEQISENPDLIFILETHSEHLLLRLLRRIRETTDGEIPSGIAPLRTNQLCVNYIESPDGQVKIRRLEVSEDGDSKGDWPKGFFAERAGELF